MAIDADTLNCWRINYRLDKATPEEAARWWNEQANGFAPSGAVAALGLCINEIERMRASLHEIAEEWAGAECGEPVYAQEAYAIALAKRMYGIASAALAAKEK